MPKTATITVKVDPRLNAEVEEIFQELGITRTEAIDLFYHQIQRYHGLPFEPEIPNAETLQAIAEAEKGIDLVICEGADDLFKKLGI